MDYINLHHPIFTQEPDIAFAKSLKVPIGFWNDLCKRHKFWDYSYEDLREWFEFKMHKPISRKTLYRWMIRQEVYNDAQRSIAKGSYIVTLNYFTRNKEYVLKYKTNEKNKIIFS
jgi:hypothetical protein